MRNGIDTTDKMQEILEAYLVLSDPVKRAEYDRNSRKPSFEKCRHLISMKNLKKLKTQIILHL